MIQDDYKILTAVSGYEALNSPWVEGGVWILIPMKTIKYLPLLLLMIAVCGCHRVKTTQQSQTKYTDAQYDGIDVSHYQGRIDWTEVRKNANIEFVYMKATEGSSYIDKCYRYNLREAKKNGFKVGAYHFFSSQSSATSQFKHFMKVAPPKDLDLVPMLDIELNAKCKWSRKQVQDSVRRWIDLCKQYYGKAPIIYSTNNGYNRWLAPEFNRYHLYLGRYGAKEPVINGKGHYSIWQFSESGSVRGIEKPVDLARYREGIGLKDIVFR